MPLLCYSLIVTPEPLTTHSLPTTSSVNLIQRTIWRFENRTLASGLRAWQVYCRQLDRSQRVMHDLLKMATSADMRACHRAMLAWRENARELTIRREVVLRSVFFRMHRSFSSSQVDTKRYALARWRDGLRDHKARKTSAQLVSRVLRRVNNRKLAAAWQSMVVATHKANLAHQRMSASMTKMVKSLKHWRHSRLSRAWAQLRLAAYTLETETDMTTRAERSNAKLITKIVARMRSRQIAAGFRKWANEVWMGRLASQAEAKKVQMVNKTLRHCLNRQLSAALQAWVLVLHRGRAAAEAHTHRVQLVTKTLRRASNRQLSAALQTWVLVLQRNREAAEALAVKVQLVSKTLRRALNRQLSAALQAWVQALHRGRAAAEVHAHRVQLVTKTLRRASNRQLSAAMQAWVRYLHQSALAVRNQKRSAVLMGKVVRRLKFRVVSSAWRAWANMHQTDRLVALTMKHQHTVLVRVTARILRRELGAAMRTWLESAITAKQQESLVERIVLRMEHHYLAMGWDTWLGFAQRSHRRERRLVASGFQRWRVWCLYTEHTEQIVLRLLGMATSADLRATHRAIVTWRTNARELTIRREVVLRSVFFRMHRSFSSSQVDTKRYALARWRDGLRDHKARKTSAQLVSRVLRRVNNRKLAAAWQSMVVATHKANLAHQRMSASMTKMVKSLKHWRHSRLSRAWAQLRLAAYTLETETDMTTRAERSNAKLIKKVVARMRSRMIAAGLRKWEEEASVLRRASHDHAYRVQLVKKVLARMRSRQIAAGFRKWRDGLRDHKARKASAQHRAQLVSKTLRRASNRQLSAAMQAWVQWVHATALASRDRSRNATLMGKVVKHIAYRALSSAWRAWVVLVHRAALEDEGVRSRVMLMRKVVSRFQHRTLYHAFRQFLVFCRGFDQVLQTTVRRSQIITRALSRMRNRKIYHAFRVWLKYSADFALEFAVAASELRAADLSTSAGSLVLEYQIKQRSHVTMRDSFKKWQQRVNIALSLESAARAVLFKMLGSLKLTMSISWGRWKSAVQFNRQAHLSLSLFAASLRHSTTVSHKKGVERGFYTWKLETGNTKVKDTARGFFKWREIVHVISSVESAVMSEKEQALLELQRLEQQEWAELENVAAEAGSGSPGAMGGGYGGETKMADMSADSLFYSPVEGNAGYGAGGGYSLPPRHK